jgi:Zn-dependent M28 family amino/carboxypeptidase
MARPLLRILVASAASALVLFTAAAMVMRQPTFARPPHDGPRADRTVLRRHVEFLTDAHLTGRDPAPYIAEAFRAAGAEVCEQTFQARGRTSRNIVAGFGRGGPLLIVGAHYDAFAIHEPLPGADDNASGTAALLELARLLGARPPSSRVELVAFANEEPPFFGSEQMGSAVHAESLARAGTPVAGMICLEMIGYYTASQRWPSWVMSLVYPQRGDFVGVAGGWDDRALARRVKEAINGAGGVAVSFTGPRAMLDASDQRSYWARGWKAVMITDTAYLRNPNYHTARDTAATLDYARMAHVVDGVFGAVGG